MSLPDTAYTYLADDLRICRILNGMWQVSGAHGAIDPATALDTMMTYHEAGFTTWDLADHYGPAEDFIGDFRAALAKKHGESALQNSQALTKWVPGTPRISAEIVSKAVETALGRMKTDALDVLQFHWWEYRDSNYLSALNHLVFLMRQGKIKHLALTNFDTKHLRNISDNGMRLVSNQVQFSIIDRRPEVAMIPYCQSADIKLLAYGTVAGGLLTDRYLGQPEPKRDDLKTASLRKYKNMVDQWGGWGLFQELLEALRGVADRHGVSIANVAVRYVLDKPTVAGAILGVRLGVSDNLDDNRRVFDFALAEEDLSAIHAVTDRANDLFKRIGDCGAEYRR